MWPADAQKLGGLGNIAVGKRQSLRRQALFDPRHFLAQIEIPVAELDVAQIQVLGGDALVFRHDHCAFHLVLQLADIAGPSVG